MSDVAREFCPRCEFGYKSLLAHIKSQKCSSTNQDPWTVAEVAPYGMVLCTVPGCYAVLKNELGLYTHSQMVHGQPIAGAEATSSRAGCENTKAKEGQTLPYHVSKIVSSRILKNPETDNMELYYMCQFTHYPGEDSYMQASSFQHNNELVVAFHFHNPKAPCTFDRRERILAIKKAELSTIQRGLRQFRAS